MPGLQKNMDMTIGTGTESMVTEIIAMTEDGESLPASWQSINLHRKKMTIIVFRMIEMNC